MDLRTVEAFDDLNPVCPFCESELTEILFREAPSGFFQARTKFVFFCPQCRKILGVGLSEN